VEQIKSQLEFLKKLYPLKETTDSIAERAESWVNDDEESIPFQHRLMKSPLAQRTVRDLIYWISDIAGMLTDYEQEGQGQAFMLLQDFGARSLEKQCESDALNTSEPEFHNLDLSTLDLAARTLFEIIDEIFDRLLFRIPWPQGERKLDFVTQNLRLIDQKLIEVLYWLGKILDDLGTVMAPDGKAAA